jgi:hypothetical protein
MPGCGSQRSGLPSGALALGAMLDILRAIALLVVIGIAVPFIAKEQAILQGLDKVTARVVTLGKHPIDKLVRFGPLEIVVRTCSKRPPQEPPETTVFIQIYDVRHGGLFVVDVRIESGYGPCSIRPMMFGSSTVYSILNKSL